MPTTETTDAPKTNAKPRRFALPIGVSLGVALGAGIGTALGNTSIGIAIGCGVGIVLGCLGGLRRSKER